MLFDVWTDKWAPTLMNAVQQQPHRTPSRPLAWLIREFPHALTAMRGLAGPLLVWIIVEQRQAFTAFFVFLIAILSDTVDGWLAKKLNSSKNIGRWLDPFSDKVLTNCTWIALWLNGWVPSTLALIMILRDVIVIVVWLFAYRRAQFWEASVFGRLMISFEGVSLATFLLRERWLLVYWPSVGLVAGFASLLFSALSVLHYIHHGPRQAPQ